MDRLIRVFFDDYNGCENRCLIPHMMRSFSGPDNRRLVPVSLLAGAILMLFADTTTRALLPVEIPIGVLTALIGAPVFCWIFRKNRIKSMT